MQKFNSVDELVNTIQPVDPIYCIRPNSIKSACSWFKNNFPGKILYAVKTNPNEEVIKYIGKNGINHFDVASAFIKSIRGSDPNAAVYYLARMIEGGEDPKASVFISGYFQPGPEVGDEDDDDIDYMDAYDDDDDDDEEEE